MTIVVGGVGQLYQGDLDLGRLVVTELASRDIADVSFEDFHYGAVAVSQRIDELAPTSVVLIGADSGEREPGTVERMVVPPDAMSPRAAQDSIEGAVTGYVTPRLVVDVMRALGETRPRIVLYEVEPYRIGPSEEMSPEMSAAFPSIVARVEREIGLTPLFSLCEDIEERLSGLELSGSLRSIHAILEDISALARGDGWGRVFSLRDRLRGEIANGATSESMSHLDWSLWWALIEELDRLQRVDAAG